MDLVECLSFLFQISFATLGKVSALVMLLYISQMVDTASKKFQFFLQDYSTEGMSESQLKFLQHLREFGLVFQRKVLC